MGAEGKQDDGYVRVGRQYSVDELSNSQDLATSIASDVRFKTCSIRACTGITKERYLAFIQNEKLL